MSEAMVNLDAYLQLMTFYSYLQEQLSSVTAEQISSTMGDGRVTGRKRKKERKKRKEEE